MIALLLSFAFSSIFACDFRADVSRVYSLSGPVTQFLEDNQLLQLAKVRGISAFHPAKNFQGERLPGGIYLSQTKLNELKGALVFFDASAELRRLFKLHPEIRSLEIHTRGLSPLEVVKEVQRQLTSFTKDCDFRTAQRLGERLERLRTLVSSRPMFIFFLGKLQPPKIPDLVMVNDGIVKWMVSEGLVRSYPSNLAYVNWSAKVLSELPDHRKVGISDSGGQGTKALDSLGRDFNLTYPGALIPGLGQVEAMIYLFENLPR